MHGMLSSSYDLLSWRYNINGIRKPKPCSMIPIECVEFFHCVGVAKKLFDLMLDVCDSDDNDSLQLNAYS